jgi:hypothetical protein
MLMSVTAFGPNAAAAAKVRQQKPQMIANN